MSTVEDIAIDYDLAKELGLLPEEFDRIKSILGRTPNYTEISIFSVMWSEHCSYKNSIKWLKTLPRKGERILVEAGEENAGLVSIGDGLSCCFKIESHNHPSALEPFQGAATGVGGINRDIFTMGARPIAQLNSLRFGSIKEEKTKWLVKGVVSGIGHYGNCFGVPVVGGEVVFDESYNTNPLVNAMSVGIMEDGKMLSAISKGAGNPVFIVGSATGKDGIHGATFASEDITEDSEDKIPAVQVGDPFQEKLLLEASLELADSDAIIGMQDMGAAGITCSTSEMSEKGGFGMDIQLDQVPTRQKGMEPFEILLSESQERMLVVVKKGREQEVVDIFEKWDLHAEEIGVVTEGDQLRYFWNGEKVAQVPAPPLCLGGGAPIYEREYKEPASYQERFKFNIKDVDEPLDLKEVIDAMIVNPNLASKKWVIEQYDTMVQTNNKTTNKVSDAGIVAVKGTDKALAVTTDCNARYVQADPEKGTMIAVAEASRNIVCSGGEPVAITNCLNFGNPYDPEVYWQFVGAIKGMGAACEKFGTPVTGGNVSFYNQSNINGVVKAVFPTPTIGMLGILEDKRTHTGLSFQNKGDLIFMIGKAQNDLNSSEYLTNYLGIKETPAPHFELEEEFQLQAAIKDLIQSGILQSCHDVSDGGLFMSLFDKCLANELGFDITLPEEFRRDAFLFGESQSRVMVSIKEGDHDLLLDLMEREKTPFLMLGHVTKGDLRIDHESYGFIDEMKPKFENALGNYIES
ncbi:MAG: phosphoribosylformylglycinamidine synthase II [Glaciecola sp.]|jgi:phosphoribosylformylglycinamidine synthase II